MSEVAVIIPTYNRARLLPRAVRSVLRQTFQDFEIVIVDDASPAGSPLGIEDLKDPRIRVLRHQQNRGVAAARNTGIVHSCSRYVAFLDDDDEWHAHKLQTQIDRLRNRPHNVAGLYAGFSKIDELSGKQLSRWIPDQRGDLLQRICLENVIGTPSTVLLRRDCLEAIGLFDESIRYGEEYDLWIRICHKYEMEAIPETLVNYYRHSTNASKNYAIMISGIKAQLRKHGALFARNPKNHSRLYLALGVLYCFNRNLEEGRKSLLQAIRLYPFEIRHYFNLALSLLGADCFRVLKELKES